MLTHHRLRDKGVGRGVQGTRCNISAASDNGIAQEAWHPGSSRLNRGVGYRLRTASDLTLIPRALAVPVSL